MTDPRDQPESEEPRYAADNTNDPVSALGDPRLILSMEESGWLLWERWTKGRSQEEVNRALCALAAAQEDPPKLRPGLRRKLRPGLRRKSRKAAKETSERDRPKPPETGP